MFSQHSFGNFYFLENKSIDANHWQACQFGSGVEPWAFAPENRHMTTLPIACLKMYEMRSNLQNTI